MYNNKLFLFLKTCIQKLTYNCPKWKSYTHIQQISIQNGSYQIHSRHISRKLPDNVLEGNPRILSSRLTSKTVLVRSILNLNPVSFQIKFTRFPDFASIKKLNYKHSRLVVKPPSSFITFLPGTQSSKCFVVFVLVPSGLFYM